MTLIFFIIFSVVIFGVMILLSLVRGVTSLIFGRHSSPHSGTKSNYTGGEHEDSSSKSDKKIFSKEEGEYVKFEEIKD